MKESQLSSSTSFLLGEGHQPGEKLQIPRLRRDDKERFVAFILSGSSRAFAMN